MRRKIISLILVSSILCTCIGLVGCKKKDENAKAEDTTNIEESNVEFKEKEDEDKEENKIEEKNNNQIKDNENKNKTESNIKAKEKNKDTTKIDNSKSQGNKSENSKTNNSSSKQKSDKEHSNLSKEQLVKNIIEKQSDLKTFSNITPVKAKGQGDNLSYEYSSGSDVFFCSNKKFNSKKIDSGIVVNFMGTDKDKKGEYYSFNIGDYEAIKNGGKGTIAKGKAYKDGQVILN